jgi:O-acetyl-ADP-ribose deacetylase (regulator of RNase III)
MEIITGNLIKLAQEGKFDVIVHGCNCFTTMGSGIARQIRDLYPKAYEADCKTVSGDRAKLGTFTKSVTDEGFVIVNAYTQYDFNTGGANDDVFEYEAFMQMLVALRKETIGGLRFGFPAIGCGLAGGNKDVIYSLIRAFAHGVEQDGGTVTIVEFG